eukprot:7913929-Prorocentrum_lima.AAC.1
MKATDKARIRSIFAVVAVGVSLWITTARVGSPMRSRLVTRLSQTWRYSGCLFSCRTQGLESTND